MSTPTEEPTPVTPDDTANKAVVLTIYEWHVLLREVEYLFNICNRSQHNAKLIYGHIATQLAGYEVDLFKQEEEAKATKAAALEAAMAKPANIVPVSPKPSFWKRLFGRSS